MLQKRLILTCILLLYLVVLAGSIVRSTGSGMGCPDWPKCFGLWIPPTNINQLPPDFITIYSNGGLLEVEFNVFKTWTEYINRLLGALLGIVILLSGFVLFINFSQYKKSSLFMLLATFLVGFQAWLGAKVVSTNLGIHMITIHMFTAILILLLLILSYFYLSNIEPKVFFWNVDTKLIFIFLVLLFIQIFIGTQVRQEVDLISKKLNFSNRDMWLNSLSNVFIIHRIFSYILILLSGYLYYRYYALSFYIKSISIWPIIMFVIGLILTYFDMLPFAQPIHLITAFIAVGHVFYVILKSGYFILK